MKKTILILSLLLACTFSSKAQSDATKEETKKWIYSTGESLLLAAPFYSSDYYTRVRIFFGSRDNIDFFDVENSDDKNNGLFTNQQIFFKDIKKLTLTIDNKIWFKTDKKVETKRSTNSFNVKKFLSDYCYLKLKDRKSSQRFFKAFKHLLSFYNLDVDYEDLTLIENKF